MGCWEDFGNSRAGRSNQGRTLEDGLRREIREELGIEIQVGEACGIYKHAYTHFQITLHAFFCSANGNDPRPIEADEIHWVAPGEMGDYPMGKVDRLIARMLMEQDG